MDHTLNARISIDVPADVVRIDILGSLDQQSRPVLIHIIGRIRRMGIRSHIRVDLSQAELVASAALAGLRSDLNAMDALTLPGIYGAGVSIAVTPAQDAPAPGQPLTLGGGAPGAENLPAGLPPAPAAYLDELCGRPLAEYADHELLAASDALFSLLDNPGTLAGADLLGRYNDVGQEIVRRQQAVGGAWPAGSPASLPATGNQAAS
ncbi:hypothetical protein ACIQCM_13055 [Pseudarthrobacter sp. NPDC092439]|uniref:hypothetical protein n=1 Tax=unclassified Pseudarthrobacter TaxID=2647000 RepID=UPI003829F581